MKTIIFLSSIFYILGLKLGHKIDVIKVANPVTKITNTTNAVKSAAKSVYYSDEISKIPQVDSLKTVNQQESKAAQAKHF